MNRTTCCLIVILLSFGVFGIPVVLGGGYMPEPDPILPDPPDGSTLIQAVQELLRDLPVRSDSSMLGGPIRFDGPMGPAFTSLQSGEQMAARGESPVAAYQAAIDGFSRAVERNPNDLGAHRGLVRSQAGLCGFEALQGKASEGCILKAKIAALEGLKNAPDDPGLLHLLGNVETSLATLPELSSADRAKHYTEAARYYDRAAAGGYVFSRYALGMLYLSLGNYAEAAKQLRDFQARFGEALPGLEQALAQLDQAIKAEPSRDLDQAFTKLLKDGDRDAAARLFASGLKQLHDSLGIPAGQEQPSAPAHDRFRHATAHYNLASIYAQQGKLAEAYQALEQALKLGWTQGTGPGDRRGKGQLRRQLENDPDLAPLRQDTARWAELLSLAG